MANVDVDSALRAKNEYGVDGIMIGRATVGNPWIFRDLNHFFKTGERLSTPSVEERVHICKRHLMDSIEWKGEYTSILEIRRHYPHYFKGLPDFKPYRMNMTAIKKRYCQRFK